MDNLTKEELRSLTIEKLNGMTEEQLDEIANQVIELLDEKIKNNTDPVLLNEAILNLEESLTQSEILIKEYREKMLKARR